MGTTDGIFPKANLDLLKAFGETVIYTPKTGAPKEIQAIVSIGEDSDDSERTAALQVTGSIAVLVSDMESPEYQETVTIRGDTWYLGPKIAEGGGMQDMKIHRNLRPTLKRG